MLKAGSERKFPCSSRGKDIHRLVEQTNVSENRKSLYHQCLVTFVLSHSILKNSNCFHAICCHQKILKTSFSPQHFTFTKSKLCLLRKLAPPSRISWLHHLNLHCPPRGNRCLPRADSAGNIRSGMSTIGDPTNTLDIYIYCIYVCMCVYPWVCIHLHQIWRALKKITFNKYL